MPKPIWWRAVSVSVFLCLCLRLRLFFPGGPPPTSPGSPPRGLAPHVSLHVPGPSPPHPTTTPPVAGAGTSAGGGTVAAPAHEDHSSVALPSLITGDWMAKPLPFNLCVDPEDSAAGTEEQVWVHPFLCIVVSRVTRFLSAPQGALAFDVGLAPRTRPRPTCRARTSIVFGSLKVGAGGVRWVSQGVATFFSVPTELTNPTTHPQCLPPPSCCTQFPFDCIAGGVTFFPILLRVCVCVCVCVVGVSGHGAGVHSR
jgi:hypothetical protein